MASPRTPSSVRVRSLQPVAPQAIRQSRNRVLSAAKGRLRKHQRAEYPLAPLSTFLEPTVTEDDTAILHQRRCEPRQGPSG